MTAHTVQLGLKANFAQFSLLVLVNAFVGGMVGLERTLVPLIGSEEFKLTATTFIGFFVISFGLVKAFANLFSGPLADTWGRRPVLIIGWLLGLPVPWLIMYAPSWSWIVAANILLGLNQGFAWSMTVIMKVDLVGPSRRGLAMGINEFSGYLAVGITANANWADDPQVHAKGPPIKAGQPVVVTHSTRPSKGWLNASTLTSTRWPGPTPSSSVSGMLAVT